MNKFTGFTLMAVDPDHRCAPSPKGVVFDGSNMYCLKEDQEWLVNELRKACANAEEVAKSMAKLSISDKPS